MRIPLRYQSAQNTAKLRRLPADVDFRRRTRLVPILCRPCVRRHQLLACRDSYAELLDRRGDATWLLTVGRLPEAGPYNSARIAGDLETELAQIGPEVGLSPLTAVLGNLTGNAQSIELTRGWREVDLSR